MEDINKIPQEGISVEQDPLSLDVDDKTLVKFIDRRIRKSTTYFKTEKKIYSRQKDNLDYWKGLQIDEKNLRRNEARFVDNAIYEAIATIKPIALSKMPDLLVKQSEDTPESKQNAKSLTTVLNSDLKKRSVRKILGVVIKHVPIYFMAVIKPLWNPELGEDGEYSFEIINPNHIVFDHTATSNDTDDMEFIAELTETTIKELIMRFPQKKEDIFKELETVGINNADENNEAKMATKVKYWEVHFTWYESAGKEQYKRIEGVAWKYKKVILRKMKDPNWDWTGEDKVFTYDTAKKKEELASESDLRNNMVGMMMGQEMSDSMTTKKVYHNHFSNPKKPYILLGYEQLSTGPYDETSIIEQVKYLQDNVNKRGKQISELADQAKGKDVFSTESGLEKADLEEVNMADPTTALLVDGKLSEVYTRVQGQMPSQALYEEQNENRTRIFDIMGTHATTRGKKETHVATTSQILREADYGRIDDFTEDVINCAAEEMANWAMQFIKLRYTKDHFRRLLGNDGEVTFQKVNRDMVSDGMEIVVSASSVDKTMRKREAYERAKMKLTDPLSFFEDTNVPNPKERTERLMTFLSDPNTYTAKYVLDKKNTNEQAQALNNQNQPNMPSGGQPPSSPQGQSQGNAAPPGGNTGGGQAALQDIQLLTQGQQPPQPANVDAQYLQTLEKFLQSPDFKQLPPQIQQMAIQFAQQLTQIGQQSGTM